MLALIPKLSATIYVECTHPHIHTRSALSIMTLQNNLQFPLMPYVCERMSVWCRLSAENRYCTREILRKTLIHTHMLRHIGIPTTLNTHLSYTIVLGVCVCVGAFTKSAQVATYFASILDQD